MAMRRCDADEHHYDDSRHSSCPYCRTTVPYFADDDFDDEPESAGTTTAFVPAEPATAHTQVFGIDKAQIPVVGWLVVISGPPDPSGRDNKGRDLRLVPGLNRVGRSAGMEIPLDFGDPKIGRDSHCVVTFDPESNAFYVQGGQGRNLTYVLGEPASEGATPAWEVVLQPRKLEYLDNLRVGDTILVFVPLCNERFKWNFSE